MNRIITVSCFRSKVKTWAFLSIILMVLISSSLILRELNMPMFNKVPYMLRNCPGTSHTNKWVISSDTTGVSDSFQNWNIYDFSKERICLANNGGCNMAHIKQHIYKSSEWIKKGLIPKQTVGYLVAISNGAQFVYSTDTDVTGSLPSAFTYHPYSTGLLFERNNYFSPYNHFGKGSAWPSFLPLPSSSKRQDNSTLLSLVYTPTPYIQTVLIHGDTNIISLSNKLFSSTIFDERAPPVFVSAGVISHYKPSNTLFSRKAFWALLQPFSDSLQSCDAWQSFWSQRLLWEIDGKLGFFPSNMIKHVSTTTSDTVQQYDWAKHLRMWTCPSKLSFFDCALLLSNNMTSVQPCNSFMNNIIKDWIHDLKSVGYPEPKRRKFNFTRGDPDANFDTVLANVSYMAPLKYLNDLSDQEVVFEQFKGISSICRNHPLNPPLNYLKNTNSRRIYNDIVLLIVFNFPHYDNIPQLELTYGAVFPRIVYCGSNEFKFQKSAQQHNFKVTFISVEMENGCYNYRCMSMVMKMNYKVDGYLFLGDDVLLNPKSIEKMPPNKLWIPGLTLIRRSLTHHQWGNWQLPFGRAAILSVWKELERLSQSYVPISKGLAQFKENILNNTGFVDGIVIASADIYYIPSKYQNEFIFYSDQFLKHKVFLELTVGTIIAGLAPKSEISILSGKYLWSSQDRKLYSKYFDKNEVFLHPVKFGPEFASTSGLEFFCQKYYPSLLYGDS